MNFFIGVLAIDGVACMGKTTAIAKWDGKTLLNGNWLIQAKYLDYHEMKEIYPEFVGKQGKPFVEMAYSLIHSLRTVISSDCGGFNCPGININTLLLVNRSCIANLVYHLLFFLEGEKDYENLYDIFLKYDNKSEDLSTEDYQTIRDIETCVKIIGKEFRRFGYHVVFVIPTNPFKLLERMIERNYFDANFASIDYIRSQAFLFKRFADLLPESTVSIMRVDDVFTLDEHQLTNHMKFNQCFC